MGICWVKNNLSSETSLLSFTRFKLNSNSSEKPFPSASAQMTSPTLNFSTIYSVIHLTCIIYCSENSIAFFHVSVTQMSARASLRIKIYLSVFQTPFPPVFDTPQDSSEFLGGFDVLSHLWLWTRSWVPLVQRVDHLSLLYLLFLFYPWSIQK